MRPEQMATNRRLRPRDRRYHQRRRLERTPGGFTMKRMTLQALVVVGSVLATGRASAVSFVHPVNPGTMSTVPFGVVMTAQQSGTSLRFEVWVAAEPGDESVLASLSIAGSDTTKSPLVSVPLKDAPYAGGKLWSFNVDQELVARAVLSVAFVAEQMPAFDGWRFELGPLLDGAFVAYPWTEEGWGDWVPPDGAPVDSLDAWFARWRAQMQARTNSLNDEHLRRRLELGPESERRRFHAAEPK